MVVDRIHLQIHKLAKLKFPDLVSIHCQTNHHLVLQWHPSQFWLVGKFRFNQNWSASIINKGITMNSGFGGGVDKNIEEKVFWGYHILV